MSWLRLGRIRKRNENRIQRKSRKLNTVRKDPDAQIDDILRPYTTRAEKFANRAINTVNSRKGEGKPILIGAMKHMVGDTARAFLGPRTKQSKSASSIRISKPKMRTKKGRQK